MRFYCSFEASWGCAVARKDVLGPGHPSTSWIMTRVASTLGRLGRYDESLRLHSKTLRLKKRVHSEEYIEVLFSMNEMLMVLRRLNRYEEAEEMSQRVVELTGKAVGLNHLNTSIRIRNFEWICRERNEHAVVEAGTSIMENMSQRKKRKKET